MALTLIPEDGTGLTTANSFCSLAEADAYHTAHLYGATWLAMIDEEQKAALIQAARILSTRPLWNGTRVKETQALAFPRSDLIDRDGFDIPDSSVPVWLKNANAELGRLLKEKNREADPDSTGIAALSVGSISLTFDKANQEEVIPDSVMAFIAPYCSVPSRSGITSVRTLRV